ncbi:hypothetical protein PVAND_015108 [Polypedilum vanderplanki]|uniref:Uncharacterized protein n=1 Tax=Polypedilum vanderplanki TaxID=319348 RepID=A0A9J6BBN3_POLVA|nr:hypothetical protein PVAND_015108 [Polypedilum vanderplanki]
MSNLRFWIIGILLMCCHSVTSQYSGPIIDAQLTQINSGLMAEETKLSQQIKTLISTINQTNSNLQTQNKTLTTLQQKLITNFYASFQDLANLLTDLSTLKNFWPYTNVTTCADASRKETEIDFNIRYFEMIGAKVWSNLTRLTAQYNWVAYNGFLAYSTIITKFNNGTMVQQQISQTMALTGGLMTEYNKYFMMLTKAVVNESTINVYLSFFRNQICKCPTNFSSAGNTNLTTLTTNVQYVEQPLVSLETAVIAAANAALSNANTAVNTLVDSNSSALWLAINVNRTVTFLTNLVTTNTYYNITWNTVKACSDLSVRTSYVSLKYWQYTQAWFGALANTTATYALQGSLNTTAAFYKLNTSQSTAVAALIGSMKKLEPLMSNYSAQLAYSAGKMMRIYLDMVFLGVTYCSCSDLSTTTTPKTTITTTTKPAITTTTKPTTTKPAITTTTKPTTTIKGATITTTKPTTTTNASTTSTVSTTTIPLSGTTTTTSIAGTTTSTTSTPADATTTTTTTTTPSTTTSTTTTAQSTSTTVAPDIPCGFWITYSMDSAPSINGLAVGTSWQGTTSYLGRGWYAGQYIPGRIDITPGKQALYVTLLAEVKITSDIEYFVVPSNCNCSFLSPDVAATKNGVVINPDPVYSFATGLVNLSNGQVAISKVETVSKLWQWWSSSGGESSGPSTQILVCSSTNSAVVKPTITYASKACAGWTMYTGDYSPTINGWSAGLSRVNTQAYIGRAYENGYFAPGRVDVTPGSAGVYVSYYTATNSEQYITGPAEYLVITDNCVCSWISATTAAYSRPGLIKTTDISVHWLTGLVNISSTQVSVSPVAYSTFVQYYTDLSNTGRTNTASVLLVCETP